MLQLAWRAVRAVLFAGGQGGGASRGASGACSADAGTCFDGHMRCARCTRFARCAACIPPSIIRLQRSRLLAFRRATDVFPPEIRLLPNQPLHECDAPGIVRHMQRNAVRYEQIFRADE